MGHKQDEIDLLSCPGDTILESLPYRQLTVLRFAQQMGMDAGEAANLIQGKMVLTQELAKKLEKVLGIDAIFWTNSEELYRKKLAVIKISRINKYL